MTEAKKRLLSGVKPTGRPHIGNYFGAMKQFVDLQDQYDAYYMVADYHGLNFIQNGEEMRSLIKELVKDYIGIGLDASKATLFKQSDISEHTELAWIFDAITDMAYLMRAHAFKASVADSYGKLRDEELQSQGIDDSVSVITKPLSELFGQIINDKMVGGDIPVGTFNYPMLMAADILLYDATVVPVGQDQKQHIEYARDTAEKFNRIFGESFTLPREIIIAGVATVPGTDGRKMSKSYGNTIPLFATKDEITKAVMSIVTNSSGGRPENVYAIHKLLKSEAELAPLYEANAGSYKILKEALIEDLEVFIAPMRARRESVTDEEVLRVLEEGGKRAKEIASAKMADVRQKIGVTL